MPLINLEDYAARTDFPVADTGDYEVVLRVERKMTKDNTKEFVNLDFKIREDVDQSFQNTHVLLLSSCRFLNNPCSVSKLR